MVYKIVKRVKETWGDIKGHVGSYQLSNWGQIKSLERIVITKNGRKIRVKEKILNLGKGNYPIVSLHKDDKQETHKVHRLVAEAHVPNPDNLPEVNHIDGNKHNNYFENLEWDTRTGNAQKAYDMGLMSPPLKGANHPQSKFVFQFELNGKFVKEYGSINEAERKTNISHSSISWACKGKAKTAGGYIWKYADDKKVQKVSGL